MRELYSGLLFGCVVTACLSVSLTLRAESDTKESSDTKTAGSASKMSGSEKKSGDLFGIGDSAPVFKDLSGTDGKLHGLAEYAKAKALAILFICNHCPVVVDYEERIMQLQKDFADEGLQLIAINVNKSERDALAAMTVEAKKRGYTFPYLFDPTQQIARDFGAILTPHVFLLDNERKLAYVGSFDDNRDAAKVTKTYLRDAVVSVLAGNVPDVAEIKPFGCGIEYE